MAVTAMGAITAVGDDLPMSMGSLYTGVQLFDDLGIDGIDGEKITGGPTQIDERFQGGERLAALVALVLQECGVAEQGRRVPVIVCAPDVEQFDWDPKRLLRAIAQDLPFVLDERHSRVLPSGRASMTAALRHLAAIVGSGPSSACFLVGIDSLILESRVRALLDRGRISDTINPGGVVPGEAAAAILVSGSVDRTTSAIIAGIGHSGGAKPSANNAALLAEAAERALAQAKIPPKDLVAFCHDGSGAHEDAEELALVRGRPPLCLVREAESFVPAVSTGDIGAAAGVLSLAMLSFFMQQGVVDGPALAMFSSEDATRAAATLVPVSRKKGN